MNEPGMGARLWQRRTLLTRTPALAPLTRTLLRILSAALRHNPFARTISLPYANVGCGRKPRPGFVNLDYSWYPGVDVVNDITKSLPFDDGSLKGIFTEHCLEHIPFELVRDRVMPEFFRVLEPGGVLRVVVPDAGLYLETYNAVRQGLDASFPEIAEPLDTPMMYVNRCFRDFGHMFAYDFDTMKLIVTRAGFKSVARRAFRVGDVPALLIDSPERAAESLYLEAIK